MPKNTGAQQASEMTVLKSLTKAQWIEIFNALPVGSPAYKAMKTDCRIESEGMGREDMVPLVKHTRVIYSAVWGKVANWLYDDRKWKREMTALLAILEPFAFCEMCGAEPGDIPSSLGNGRFTGKPVTLHTWKAAQGGKHRLCMICRAGKPEALKAQVVALPSPSWDNGSLGSTLKEVRDLQHQFLNAVYDLELEADIESIDPATDFRKVSVDQLTAKALPAVLVYTLLFSHANGNDVWLFTTDEGARKRLAKVVRDNWDGDNDAPEEAPEDDEEAIEMYFYDGRPNESYEISATTVDGPVPAQQPLPADFIGPCLKCGTQCIDGGEGTVFCPKCKQEEARVKRAAVL